MLKLELDTEFIEKKLAEMERSRAWLGRKIGSSNSSMVYIWTVRPISRADDIAVVLGVEPKSLIKQVRADDE